MSANLKKLGGQKRTGSQSRYPFFLKFSDTTALILVSLFGGTSRKLPQWSLAHMGHLAVERWLPIDRPTYQ
jgi:hypothetical protein